MADAMRFYRLLAYSLREVDRIFLDAFSTNSAFSVSGPSAFESSA